MEQKQITIRDVARKAGVSIGTVSRAFNNYSDISEKTREQILSIAEDLGYKANGMKKNSESSKNFRVAVLIEDYDTNAVLNPMVFETMMAFKNVASRQGYEVIILSTTTDIQKDKKLMELFQEKKLDGAFIMGIKLSDEYFKELSSISYPCVLFDVRVKNPNITCIGVDNIQGAFMAVEHLIKHGHKKIAFINGHKNAFVSYERLSGYYLALSSYNIEIDQNLIVHSDFTSNGGKKAIEELLSSGKEFSAVFCASDLMAIGAIEAFDSLGISVPDDISIVGFDDITIAQYVNPKLTTIKQDREKIGASAANALINLINEQTLDRGLVMPELIERESTKELVENEP